ncbi:unnamed protein product [Dicrocoelium dendriticum]|nr:unnamed protein product [Dicrocoelium dendriticum]
MKKTVTPDWNISIYSFWICVILKYQLIQVALSTCMRMPYYPNQHLYSDDLAYLAKDYLSMDFRYPKDSALYRMYLSVRLWYPAFIVSFNATRMTTGEVLLHCTFYDGPNSHCCHFDRSTRYSTYLYCHYVLYSYNHGYGRGGIHYTDVAYQVNFVSSYAEDTVLFYELDTPDGVKRYVAAFTEEVFGLPCGEIAKNGSFGSNGALVKQINVPETRSVELEGFLNSAVKVKEFSLERMVIRNWRNYNWDIRIFLYFLDNTYSLAHHMIIASSEYEASEPAAWRYTEQIQVRASWQSADRLSEFWLKIPMRAVALLVLVGFKPDTEGGMDQSYKYIQPYLESFLRNEPMRFEYMSGGNPALRLIKLSPVRNTIFMEGEKFVLYLWKGSNETTGGCEAQTKCYKKNSIEDEYELTDQLYCAEKENTFVIKSLARQHTGIYKCDYKRPEYGNVIIDYPIFVLSGEKAITLVASAYAYERGNITAPVWRQVDYRGRMYLTDKQTMFINCVFDLMTLFGNMSDLNLVHLLYGTRIRLPFAHLRTWSEYEGIYRKTYRVYRITPHIRTNKITSQSINCVHHFKPDPKVTGQDPDTIPRRALAYKRRVVFHSNGKEPKIVTLTIRTSLKTVTETLTQPKSRYDRHFNFRSMVPQTVSSVMFLTGSFVTLRYRQFGWDSVWTIRVDDDGEWVRHNCSVTSQLKAGRDVTNILNSPEADDETVTFVASLVTFSCAMPPETVGLVLSVYNVDEKMSHQRNTLEGSCIKRLLTVLTQYNRSNSATWEAIDTAGLVSHHRLVRLYSRWNATLSAGSPAMIHWIADGALTGIVMCYFDQSKIPTKGALPTGFLVNETRDNGVVMLVKENSVAEDSGLYACYQQLCDSCELNSLGPARRLVVLPSSADVQIAMDYKRMAHKPEREPTIITNQAVNISCSITLPLGIIPQLQWQFTHDTLVEPNGTYLSLPYTPAAQEVGAETVGRFHITGVEPRLNWGTTRVTCYLDTSVVTRDEFDITSVHEIPKVGQERNITVEDRLAPLFLHNLTTGDSNLSKHIRLTESGYVNQALWNQSVQAVVLTEGPVELSTVVFTGFPPGELKSWLVYRERSDVELEPCEDVNNTSINGSDPLIAGLDITVQTRGRNMRWLHLKCWLVIEHLGLVTTALNSFDKGSEEKEFKSHIIDWFTKLPVSGKSTETKRRPFTAIARDRYQVVKVDVRWKAIANINDSLEMKGRLWQSIRVGLNCTKILEQSGPDPVFGQVDLSMNFTDDASGFVLSKEGAAYHDSGLYECFDPKCANGCPIRIGFAPRAQFVLPSQDMLEVRISVTKLHTGESVEHQFNQCDYGSQPYLFSSEVVSVRCVHHLSPFWMLKPSVYLNYEAIDRHKSMNYTMSSKLEADFSFNVNQTALRVTGYTVTAPEVNSHLSELYFTCVFSFDEARHILHDLHGPREGINLTSTRKVGYRLLLQPVIFDDLTHTNEPKVITSFVHTRGSRAMSAAQFHKIGPPKRMLELRLIIHTTVFLGMPTGKVVLWTFFQHNGLQSEDCYQSSLVALTAARLPAEMKQRQEYTISNGKGFINASFICVLRPEHVALVLMAFTGPSERQAEVESNLLTSTTETIQSWFHNPVDTVERSFSSSIRNVHRDYRIQRLHVGWYGTVKRGSIWTMLMRFLGPGEQVSRNCYYRARALDSWILINQTTTQQQYIFRSQPAKLDHAGYYTCNHSSCEQGCPGLIMAAPKRLLVLPEDEDMEVLLSLQNDLDLQRKSFYNRDDIRVMHGQNLFVWCYYRPIPGLAESVTIKFRASINSTVGDPMTELRTTLVENVTKQDYVLVGYKVTGPELDSIYEPVSLVCSADVDNSAFEEIDLTEPKVFPTVKRVKTVQFETRLTPSIYINEMESDVLPIQRAFARARKNNASAYHFHRANATINESVVKVTLVASLGIPRGEVIGLVYLSSENEIDKPCVEVLREKLTHQSVPLSIRTRHSNLYIRDANLVKSDFLCVLNQESVAVAFIAHNTFDGQSHIKVDMLSSHLSKSVLGWKSNPANFETSTFVSPPNTGLVYYMIHLHVLWKSVVSTGEHVQLLGYVTTTSIKQIKCTFESVYGDLSNPIDNGFRIASATTKVGFYLSKENVQFADLGTYVCRVGSEQPTYGFVKRLLIVLPNKTQIKLFLTHRPISMKDEWRGNYHTCDSSGNALLDNGDKAYAHCSYPRPTKGALAWSVATNISFHPKSGWHEPNNVSMFFQLKQISNISVRQLMTHELTAPLLKEFSGTITVWCNMHLALNDSTVVIPPITINKLVMLRPTARPNIFHTLVESENSVLQSRLRALSGQTSRAIDFHNYAHPQVVNESVIQWTIPVALGIPRGYFGAWVLFRHKGSVVPERCRTTSVVNLTEDTLTSEMKGDEAYVPALGLHFARITFRCLLRWEHVAMTVTTYNLHPPSLTQAEVEQQLIRSFVHVTREWFDDPTSTTQHMVQVPHESYAAMRTTKVDVQWAASVRVGSRIVLPGYLEGGDNVTNANKMILCYKHGYAHDENKVVSIDRSMQIVHLKGSNAFHLVKQNVEYTDSGEYSCNITQRDCPDCVPTIGFIPRRLSVLPDATIMQLAINPKVLGDDQDVESQYEQCNFEGTPCVRNGDHTNFYVEYPTLFMHTTQPKHQCSMQSSGSAKGDKPTVRRLNEAELWMSYGERNRHIYRLDVPLSVMAGTQIHINCSLEYARLPIIPQDSNPPQLPYVFSTIYSIHIFVRFKPDLFTSLSRSTLPGIGRALRKQTANSVFTSEAFNDTAGSQRLLEGLWQLNHSTSLGTPRGLTAVYVVRMTKTLLHADVCESNSVVYLDEYNVPPEMKNTQLYMESLGQNYVSCSSVCVVKPEHFTLLILTVNSFDYRQSATYVSQLLLKALTERIQSWVQKTRTPINQPIRLPTGLNALYQIVRISVGWPAVIPQGAPFIYSGSTTSNTMQDVPVCYYRSQVNAKPIKIDFSLGQFRVLMNSRFKAFELIKPVTTVRDAGIYACPTRRCSTCNPDRHLIVLPTDSKIGVQISNQLTPEDQPPSDSYPYVRADGRPFVYESRSLFAHCVVTTALGASLPVEITFYCLSSSAEEQSAINATMVALPPRNLNTSVGHLRSISYQVVAPPIDATNMSLRLGCRFLCSSVPPQDDMSTRVLSKQYERIRVLEVVPLLAASFWNNSIYTDHEDITALLQHNITSKVDGISFHKHASGRLLHEGLFTINYTVQLGQPSGWTRTYIIRAHSEQLITELCEVSDLKPFVNESFELNGVKIVPQFYTHVCALQPQHIALFVYVVNSVLVGVDVERVDADLCRSAIEVVRSREGHSVDTVVSFPSHAHGEYRLLKLQIGWNASVLIGNKAQMFGVLHKNGQGEPLCYFGPKHASIPLIKKENFVIHKMIPENYFLLIVEKAQFADSGCYKCELRGCVGGCPKYLGIVERRMLVIPDESVLQLHFYMSAQLAHLRSRCGSASSVVISPKTTQPIYCTYYTAVGSARDFRFETSIASTPKSLESKLQELESTEQVFIPDQLSWTNATLLLYTSSLPESEHMVTLRVSCQLHFQSIRIVHDMVGEIKAQTFHKEAELRVAQSRKPVILTDTIHTSLPWMTKALQSSSATHMNKKAFLATAKFYSGTNSFEGPINISFDADMGVPPGWIALWFVYNHNGILQLDNCTALSISVSSSATLRTEARCLLRLEHEALIISAVHTGGSGMSRSSAEQLIRGALLRNLSDWLGLKSEHLNATQSSQCFNASHRLTRVRAHWISSVPIGGSVVVHGRLGSRSADTIECFLNDKPLTVERFTLEPNEERDYFRFVATEVVYNQSGNYTCRDVNRSVSVMDVGFAIRPIHILPDNSSVSCHLSMDMNGQMELPKDETNSDALGYLEANRSAFVWCTFDKRFVSWYNPSYDLQHWMINELTGGLEGIKVHSTLKNETANSTSIVVVYEIIGLLSRFYKGPLRVDCVGTYSVVTSPADRRTVVCEVAYTIREPANGDITIVTVSRDYASQPVPLGTEFTCTGGYGLPHLTYTWIRLHGRPYLPTPPQWDDASLLPAGTGGWGGPEKTFMDQPAVGLIVQDARLIVPRDPSYRGMSYIYTCWGNNTVGGKNYSINKTVHITVMICPTKHVPIDLSVLVSSRLFAMCTLQGGPEHHIQFYGHYYLSLVRQLILGLPQGKAGTQLHLIRDNVFKDRELGAEKSILFGSGLSREQLVRRLYSMTVKPVTKITGCSAPPIWLQDVIEHLAEIKHVSTDGRFHVVLLAVDIQARINITTEASQLLKYMRTAGLNVVLATTHPHDMRFEEFNTALTDVMDPVNFTSLLPSITGAINCDACRLQLNDVSLQIKRDQLFDIICQLAGSHIPPHGPPPIIRTDIPTTRWQHGVTIGVTCVADLSQPYPGQTATALTMCKTNRIRLNELEKKEVELQQLMSTCVHELSTNVSDSVAAPRSFSLTTQVKLDKDDENHVVLCYQRQGEEYEQFYDPVNYAVLIPDTIAPTLDVPKVSAIWPKSDSRAAVLHCSHNAFIHGAEAVFLFTTDENEFRVLGRSLFQLVSAGGNASAVFKWLDVYPDLQNTSFYCLIQVSRGPIVNQRVLLKLPQETDEVKKSSALVGQPVISDCPRPPQIHFNPDLDLRPVTQDSRLDVLCEAPITSRNLLLKFYYLTTKHSIVLCADGHGDQRASSSNKEGNKSANHEVPCHPVSFTDTNCADKLTDAPNRHTHYAATCWYIAQGSLRGTPSTRIHFNVTRLHPVDFNAYAFCQSVDLYSVDEDRQEDVPTGFSPLKTIIFAMQPHIEQFYFSPELQQWVCETMSYPFVETGSVMVLNASSHWLRQQMKAYTVEVDTTQPEPMHSQLLPNHYRIHLKQYKYFTRMFYMSMSVIPGGLTRGTVELRCTLETAYKDLITNIVPDVIIDEPAVKPQGIEEAGKIMFLDCEFDWHAKPALVTLLRHIRTTRFIYDMSLVTFVFMELVDDKWIELDSAHYKRGHYFGSWRMVASKLSVHPLITLDPAFSFSASISPSSEFDTAEYFCSSHTPTGVTLVTDIQEHRILGTQKHLSAGYKILGQSSIWTKRSQTIAFGQSMHVRCVAWTTDPRNRKPTKLSLFPLEGRVNKTSITRTKYKATNVVLRSIDAIYHVENVGPLDATYCYTDDGEHKERVIMDSMHSTCVVPDIAWSPAQKLSYTRKDAITCEVRGGCDDVRPRWDWVAGPIPQITLETVDLSVVASSPNATLRLVSLSRTGTYIFRCSVSCMCNNRPVGSSILATLYVEMEDNLDGSTELEGQAKDAWEHERPMGIADDGHGKDADVRFGQISLKSPTVGEEVHKEAIPDDLSRDEGTPTKLGQLDTSGSLDPLDQWDPFWFVEETQGEMDEPPHQGSGIVSDGLRRLKSKDGERISVDQLDTMRRRALLEAPQLPHIYLEEFGQTGLLPKGSLAGFRTHGTGSGGLRGRTDLRTPHIPSSVPGTHLTGAGLKRRSELRKISEQEDAISALSSPTDVIIRDRGPLADRALDYAYRLTAIEDAAATRSQLVDKSTGSITPTSSQVSRKESILRHWMRSDHQSQTDSPTSLFQTLDSITADYHSLGGKIHQGKEHSRDIPFVDRDLEDAVQGPETFTALDISAGYREAVPSESDKQHRNREIQVSFSPLYSSFQDIRKTRQIALRYVESLTDSDRRIRPLLLPTEYEKMLLKTQDSKRRVRLVSQPVMPNALGDKLRRLTDYSLGSAVVSPGLIAKPYAEQIEVQSNKVYRRDDATKFPHFRKIPQTDRYGAEAAYQVHKLRAQEAVQDDELVESPWAQSNWKFDAVGHMYRWRDTTVITQADLRSPDSGTVQLDSQRRDYAKRSGGRVLGQQGVLRQWSQPSPDQVLISMEHHLYNTQLLASGTGSSDGWVKQYSGLEENVRRRLLDTGKRMGKSPADQVILEPSIVISPSSFTARCPNLRFTMRSNYYPTDIMWIRQLSMTNTNPTMDEPIIQFSLTRWNQRILSTREHVAERLFIYPPHKWAESHTLDMVDVVPEDFGFYTCITTMELGSLQVNVTKASLQPLCIIPGKNDINIAVERSPQMSGNESTSCYEVGEEVLVHCQAVQYQIFCEQADSLAYGLRSINTTVEAYVYPRVQDGVYKATQLTENIQAPEAPLSFSLNKSRAWRLRIQIEHHDSYMRCVMRPSLTRSGYTKPAYWDWLEAEFVDRYQKRLESYSKWLRVCVKQQMPSIQMHPRGTGKQPIALHPGQLLTCDLNAVPNQLPFFDVYPIDSRKLEVAWKYGVLNSSIWMDVTRSSVIWRNHFGLGRVRVVTPAGAEGFYLAECGAAGSNSTERMILQLEKPSLIAKMDLAISGLCVLVAALLLFKGFTLIRGIRCN